jgi:hypothetical protein
VTWKELLEDDTPYPGFQDPAAVVTVIAVWYTYVLIVFALAVYASPYVVTMAAIDERKGISWKKRYGDLIRTRNPS